MNDIVINVKDATKKFEKYTVLNNVNLQCYKVLSWISKNIFDEGKIHGLIGRNGSGKTVLFKSICGLVKLNSGEITVNGDVIGKDVSIIKNAGVIIEEPGLLRYKSGMKNLEYLYMINNKLDRKYLMTVMEKVGLDPKSRKKVGKYSMGMRQRLAIGQAIMENPEILILDEPMNGLDNHGVEDMRKIFLELKNMGKTILLASHNREDIDVLCDKVYEMDRGELKQIR